jgi:hypothetical protein
MTLKKICIAMLIFMFAWQPESKAQQSYSEIASAGKTSIFSDPFDNNKNSWFLDNLWVTGKVENGQYLLNCKNYQKSTGLSYVKVAVDQSRDYEIETSVKNIKGTGGLIFGVTAKYDHYRVELAGKKLVVALNTISTGKNNILSSVPINSSISTDSFYKITVRKYHGEFFIYLNEALIGRFDVIKPEGDQIGFNVGLNSELAVDYLNVSYINNTVSPILAENKILTKDSEAAITQKKENTGPVQTAIKTVSLGEPIITWTSPSTSRTQWDQYTVRVKASVKSSTDLSSIVFYVNGSQKGEAERRLVTGEPGNYIIEKTINLDPGENVVYFMVNDLKNGSSKSEERFFTIPEATKPVVTWGYPALSNVSVDNERLNIEVCVQSPSALKSIKVLVNGEAMGGDNVFKPSNTPDCNIKWQYPIILREGVDNSIVVIAENIAGSNPSESRIVRYSKAITQKRIALVVGNANYNSKTPLKNPIQDANLMEGTLKNLGFDVIKYTDIDLNKMREAIRDFTIKMKDYNVALFYYAGHGVQVDGKNFLIPVDAKLENQDACKWETFAVNDLMEEFEKNPNNINIAILDACRSNPFQSWVRGDAEAFTPLTNTSGTFVSFATAPGSTAADGNTGNGLFTEELVKQMNIAQPISSVFMNTRINVYARSRQLQRPQEWNDLNGEFYFKKQ